MDIVQSALDHSESLDAAAFLMAFAAGLVTSIGPCIAPRYLALASMLQGDVRRATLRTGAFVVGTALTYAAIALTGTLLMRLVGVSPYVYLALAAVFVIFGFRTLLASTHACAGRPSAVGAGGAFFMGVASSIIISPCCTPILVALGGISGSVHGPVVVTMLVGAFTLGHLTPLALVLAWGNVATTLFARFEGATATVNAGVLIALGAYYAVLA